MGIEPSLNIDICIRTYIYIYIFLVLYTYCIWNMYMSKYVYIYIHIYMCVHVRSAPSQYVDPCFSKYRMIFLLTHQGTTSLFVYVHTLTHICISLPDCTGKTSPHFIFTTKIVQTQTVVSSETQEVRCGLGSRLSSMCIYLHIIWRAPLGVTHGCGDADSPTGWGSCRCQLGAGVEGTFSWVGLKGKPKGTRPFVASPNFEPHTQVDSRQKLKTTLSMSKTA